VRGQEPSVASVASDSTAVRLLDRIAGDPGLLDAIMTMRVRARERAWEVGMRLERIVIDIDATLIGSHTEKEGAAVNFKGTFGVHPLFAYLDKSREALAGFLRPGERRPMTRRRRSRSWSCRSSSSLTRSWPIWTARS
jgi:Transposase DDE domain group 1